MKKLVATEGRLIIKVDPEENQTSGGIYLAKPSNPDLKSGIIMSVGERKDKAKEDFHIGQHVYWQANLGLEVDYEGEKLLIINQESILAHDFEVSDADPGMA